MSPLSPRAHADYLIADLGYRPSLCYSRGVRRGEERTGRPSSVDLTQPLYTFGRINEAVKQARIGRSLAVNQKEKKRAEIVLEVKKGYYQFLAAKEMLQLLKEAETKADVVVKMVKIAYETAVPEERGERDDPTRLSEGKKFPFRGEGEIG